MNKSPVPFLDLVAPHRELKPELMAVFSDALDSGQFVGGAMVEQFESSFAEFCGVRHCVAVNSGTDALRFALIAGGVQPGDIVLTVPNTFIATTEAIAQAGAIAHFIDIDESTYNMSAARLEQFLTIRCNQSNENGRIVSTLDGHPVRAVVPVHLYGQPCNFDAIQIVADCFGLMVFEDACQAHGAEYFSSRKGNWLKTGALGKAAAFSFYPGKNLGACGEGGAVTTNDELLAARVRMLRDHGQVRKYYHDIEGYNGRLDAIQAGILSVKLRHLDDWNDDRRLQAQRYDELLEGMNGVTTPYEPSWAEPIYHLYVVRVRERNRVQHELAEHGIQTALHYPIPLHLQKAYIHRGFKQGEYPAAETAAEEILSLPIFPGLSYHSQCRVAEELEASLSPSHAVEAVLS